MSRFESASGYSQWYCTQCGVVVAGSIGQTLHAAICRECGPHTYAPQWGRCDLCGHAETASCHAPPPTPPRNLGEVFLDTAGWKGDTDVV